MSMMRPAARTAARAPRSPGKRTPKALGGGTPAADEAAQADPVQEVQEEAGEDAGEALAVSADSANGDAPAGNAGPEEPAGEDAGEEAGEEAEEAEEAEDAEEAEETAEAVTLDMVQAMIDALPEAAQITEENAAEVEAQLDAIDEAKSALYQAGGDVDSLDMSRYDAACAALAALRESEETGEVFAESAAAGVLSSAMLTATDDTVEYNGLKFERSGFYTSLVSNSYAGTTYTIPSQFLIDYADYYVCDIADSAFYGCVNLTSITFEKTGSYWYLEEIGSYAFQGCTKLSSINLPDSLQTIGAWAFYGCTSLTTITIPDSVTSIENGAFANCTGLQTLKLPDNKDLSVYSQAFTGCTNLILTVPVFTDTLDTYAGVKSINYYYARPSGVTLSSNGTVTWTGLNATNVQYRVELCSGISTVSTQYVSAVSGQTSYSCTFDASNLAGNYFARVTAIAPANSTVSISDSTPVTSSLLTIYSSSTITFDANGGSVDTSSTTTATTGSDGTLYSLPTPTRTGYIFNGWYTEKDGGEEITTSTVFTSDQIVYGQWTLCTHADNTVKPSCTEDVTCSVCGGTIPATGHTAGAAVKENEVAATCQQEGSYDSVVYCSVCEEELSREKIIVFTTGHSYEAVVTAPTCTEKGYTTYACSVCDESYTADETAATGHSTEIQNAKAATCTEDGYTGDEVCTICGETITTGETIPATGHTAAAAVKENEVAATCTTEGSYDSVVYCSVCGEEVSRETVTVAAAHTTELQNAKAATCTEDGYTGDEVCTVCGKTITTGEIIPAAGHTTETQNAKAATCAEDGYTGDEVCTVCGETITTGEIIPATEQHSYETVVEKKAEATCTADGSYDSVVYCFICHKEISRETITVSATGHSTEIQNAKAATCTEDGYTGDEVCTVCGETITTGAVIPATGHIAAGAVVENEVAPTCTQDGSYDSVVYCSFCGEERSRETVTVAATGHSYETVVTAPTCTEKGYTTYTCSACGDSYTADETEATGHTAAEPVKENEVAATCTMDGSYDSVVYCSVCGEEISRETVTVAATGHSYEAVVIEATYTAQGCTRYTCTVCGHSYDTDYTAVKVLDGTDTSLKTQTTVQELTDVPEGLTMYATVGALTSDLISRVTVGEGYSVDDAQVYDVTLQYQVNGGAWVDATVDNFPTSGITVTLPYPEGTDSSYEFTVLHMFTETSARLGITAGETESPTVAKTDDGLVFTLKGLSPVAVSWKAVTTSTTQTGATTAADTSESAKTADETHILPWAALMLLTAGGMAVLGLCGGKRKADS